MTLAGLFDCIAKVRARRATLPSSAEACSPEAAPRRAGLWLLSVLRPFCLTEIIGDCSLGIATLSRRGFRQRLMSVHDGNGSREKSDRRRAIATPTSQAIAARIQIRSPPDVRREARDWRLNRNPISGVGLRDFCPCSTRHSRLVCARRVQNSASVAFERAARAPRTQKILSRDEADKSARLGLGDRRASDIRDDHQIGDAANHIIGMRHEEGGVGDHIIQHLIFKTTTSNGSRRAASCSISAT
jgi:hypothetical protein